MKLEELFIKWQHEIDYCDHHLKMRPNSAGAKKVKIRRETISSMLEDIKKLNVATVKRSELIDFWRKSINRKYEIPIKVDSAEYITDAYLKSINAT